MCQLMPEASLNGAVAGTECADQCRADYEQALASLGVDATQGFVHCTPFDLPQLPLLRALYPDAEYVVASRDPRESTVEAFFGEEVSSLLGAEFASPEHAAELAAEITGLQRDLLSSTGLRTREVQLKEELVLWDRYGDELPDVRDALEQYL
jgi:hypothetical protein